MKKKFLECPIHGLTLHRCKRRCWQKDGKDSIYATGYTEKCFKCINEGRYRKDSIVEQKRRRHVKID